MESSAGKHMKQMNSCTESLRHKVLIKWYYLWKTVRTDASAE